MLQRVFEHAFMVLPGDRRYAAERRVRGWFDLRRLERADFTVVSFGKSGRTWLRVMLSRFFQIQFELTDGGLLEFDNYHSRDARVPRVLFTHDNYLRDCTGDQGSKRAYRDKRVVLLVRHPADVTVSQYFQWKHRMRPHKVALNAYPPRQADLSPFEFMMGGSGLPKAVSFMNEWAQELDAIGERLMLRYEDLRTDTVAELGRLAAFMEIEPGPGTLEQAVEYASVENMKRREAQAASESDRLRAADTSNPDSFKTRRAKVGGYQDYFDPAQIDEIDRYIADNLHPRFGYAAAHSQ